MRRIYLTTIMLLVSLQPLCGYSDWLTRIGGGSGGGPSLDADGKLIAVTEQTPIKLNAMAIPAADVKLIFSEQIASMYAIKKDGVIVQTRQYSFENSGKWRSNPIRSATELAPVSQRALTYEEFVAAIKAGKSFDILYDQPLMCTDCKGNGFLKVKDEAGRLGVRAICQKCKGKKAIMRKQLCRISIK